jgi:TetR/AcrR family acrAB operon transcriptional repressor
VSTKRKTRIEEIGEESRARIMDAAESLFSERGVDRTSFVDIAARSGISRGSIPWHFDNKEGLVMAVVERAAARYLSPDDDGPTAPTLRATLQRVARWLQDSAAAMLYTVLIAALTSEGAVHDRYVEMHRGGRRDLATALRTWGGPGALSDASIEAIAGVLNGALIGLHLQWQVDPGFELEPAMAILADLLENEIA